MNLSVHSCGQHSSNLSCGIQEQPVLQGGVGWGCTSLPRALDQTGCGNLGEDMNEVQEEAEIWERLEKRQLGAAAGSCWCELLLSAHPEEGLVGSEQLRPCSPSQGCCWGRVQPPPKHLFPLSAETKAGSSLCVHSRAVLSRTIPWSGIKQQHVNHLLL